MEAVGIEPISDISDGHYVTGSYVMDWFQPTRIPEIFGARNLALDPNNIEYYLISEEERQRSLRRARSPLFNLYPCGSDPPTISWRDDELDREREYIFQMSSPEEQYAGGIDWGHNWGVLDEEEDEET